MVKVSQGRYTEMVRYMKKMFQMVRYMKKMFQITNHKGNAGQNHSEIYAYTGEDTHYQKDKS